MRRENRFRQVISSSRLVFVICCLMLDCGERLRNVVKDKVAWTFGKVAGGNDASLGSTGPKDTRTGGWRLQSKRGIIWRKDVRSFNFHLEFWKYATTANISSS
jgi:hypothetical protein